MATEPPWCSATVAQNGQNSRVPSTLCVVTTSSVNLKGSCRKTTKKKKQKQGRNMRNQCLLVLAHKLESLNSEI